MRRTFSALTLLVGQQEGHLVCKRTEWWGAGVVICLERGADLHTAQLMPLPLTVSCFSKIQIGFTFLVPDHLGSPGKGPLNGCVCVCALKRTLENKLNLYWTSCVTLLQAGWAFKMTTSENNRSMVLWARCHHKQYHQIIAATHLSENMNWNIFSMKKATATLSSSAF